MPRPRYPSDEERKRVKPHVRIHLSIRGHPKFAEVWASPEQRGMITEILRLASERGAAHTGDWLALTTPDLTFITGRYRRDSAEIAVRKLCDNVEWPMRKRDNSWLILVRNFARKQGLTPRLRAETPHTPHSSPSPSPSPELIKESASHSRASAEKEADAESDDFFGVEATEIVEAWRTICVPRGAPGIREVTGDRKRKLRARIREHPAFEWWQEVFNKAASQPFLFGNGKSGWRFNFDWLIANETNAVKILEGRYHDAKG